MPGVGNEIHLTRCNMKSIQYWTKESAKFIYYILIQRTWPKFHKLGLIHEDYSLNSIFVLPFYTTIILFI